MRKTFLPFGAPLIEQPEIDEVVASLKSGWLGTGPKVHKFEEMFKDYKGVKYAMALNSCTAALHLSMLAIGIKQGDEVIVPTMTFASTANAVIHVGGIPVLADCNRDTMNIAPEEIERRITKKTKAIIPVHFAGRPCKMDEIMDIARRHNLKIIEDSAHAIEAEYLPRGIRDESSKSIPQGGNGSHGIGKSDKKSIPQGKWKKTGTFGDLGCFSLFANKNITTGEGGIAITDNEDYARKIRRLRYHGLEKTEKRGENAVEHSMVATPGFKYTMMDIQAAIGIHQLPRVNKYWLRRQEIWEKYNEAFKDLPLFLPAEIPNYIKHSYHLYTILIDVDKLSITRDEFLDAMTKHNIGIGVHYIALHLHPYYQQTYGYKHGDFPDAEWISDRTVSIPLSAKLTDDDVGDVIDVISKIVSESKRYA